MRADENEHVEVHEIRGFVSADLTGALKEAQAVARGTKCRQFLFSLSLSPPPGEAVPVVAFENALARIETKLNLGGQPRAIVFHEKEGRRHAHAVWSRIDADTMTARNLPHFKRKLRDISRALYLEHGWTLPRGLMNSEARDPRTFTLTEWQQAKRMGRNARDLKEMIRECWAASDSRAAFSEALEARGLILARGDRRGHVAVTHEGEVLSIARYAAVKTKDVNAKLGPAETLPGVEEARVRMARDMDSTRQRLIQEAHDRMAAAFRTLDRERQEVTQRHRADRAALKESQRERWDTETRARSDRMSRGLQGFWDRLTGRYARLRHQNEAETYAALCRDGDERDTLILTQMTERQDLQARIQNARHHHAEMLREIESDRTQGETQRQDNPGPWRYTENARGRADSGLSLGL
ncbi:relaxase/mobilization nuclease domain-containing protein [Roseospira goensis]|uniref:relaxase/mobilization nuclease domain-containing protein n=1 Tax=Roseospira goensis TaxID=391922 RepID=UPI003CCDEB91